MDDYSMETLAVHAGEEADPQTGALRLPLYMATSFKLPGFGRALFDALLMESDQPPHAYTRWSNPTLRALEERMAALEGAPAAVATASGMAAVSAVLLTLLSQGDHMVASEVCYAGSVELFGEHLPRLGIEVSLVDTSDARQVLDAIQPNTRVVYAETPANPILRIADIALLAQLAHRAGADLVVDSTFAGPTLQRPLLLGADYVVYSLTKYLNGHGDALGGLVLGPKAGIRRIRKEMLVHLGGALSPFNAWLILRGLATLPLRMARHCQNALTVARFLADHPKVECVVYPGLESHPHHELAHLQMATGGGPPGFGGMLTFQLKGGLGAAITLAERVRLWQYATSLGHAHSLLFYYPTDLYVDAVSYLDTAQKRRIREWMGEGLVRASVGLENVTDLIADLDQALTGRTFKGLVGPVLYRLLA
ncbi:MAG: PLP-dependent aspartate aminotransferase family protein [Anaerolineae bacterium]|jgi:cystathionine beta-lyase/cystathionine gamma-synthase